MKNDTTELVSLRKAAELLGVHPATVRNWADKGELPSRRTAGGHRRFVREDVLRLAQNQPETQPLEVQVIIQNALGSTRIQVGDGEIQQERWYARMSEATRQAQRQRGRHVLESIRAYLAAGAPTSGLSQAIQLGKEYAIALHNDGLSLPDAMRGFFYFSEFVVNSILTWGEIGQPRSSNEWAEMLRQVNAYINTMLLSIAEYYEEE